MTALYLTAIRLFTVAAALTISGPATAGPISLEDWLEFSFTDAGIPAKGCAPADPAGDFCIESSGTPTSFLDSPPWTFTSAIPVIFTVTDAFASGDQFSILDFGISIAQTSVPGSSVNCGDDPVVCLGTSGMSFARIFLHAGSHSVTITPIASLGGGSGFLRAEAVPEPGTASLLGAGLLLFAWKVGSWRTRK